MAKAGLLEFLMNLLSRTYKFEEKDISSSKRICRGKLIISILDLLLKRFDKEYFTCHCRNVYPVAHIRTFCAAEKHLEAITQLLLLRDNKLRRTVVQFVKRHFVPSAGGAKCGRERLKPLVDILVATLDEETGEEVLELLGNVQRASEEYNKDLDFAKFSLADQELINTNEKIKDSIFLRYLTVPFVKRITESSSNVEVLKTYMSENIQESTLIWTVQMRRLLHATLQDHLKPFQTDLLTFVRTKTPNYRTIGNMPVYSKPFSQALKYPQVEHEIRCAEYYLRIWNKYKDMLEDVNKMRFLNNLPNTFKEITADFPNVNLDNCQIVIRSYLLTYTAKINSNKRLCFPFFDMMLKIVEEVCKSILIGENQMHIKRMFKFIYQTVSLHCEE